jgi:hypothetical protein
VIIAVIGNWADASRSNEVARSRSKDWVSMLFVMPMARVEALRKRFANATAWETASPSAAIS